MSGKFFLTEIGCQNMHPTELCKIWFEEQNEPTGAAKKCKHEDRHTLRKKVHIEMIMKENLHQKAGSPNS